MCLNFFVASKNARDLIQYQLHKKEVVEQCRIMLLFIFQMPDDHDRSDDDTRMKPVSNQVKWLALSCRLMVISTMLLVDVLAAASG